MFLPSVPKKNCFLKEKMGKKKAKCLSGRKGTKGNGIKEGNSAGLSVTGAAQDLCLCRKLLAT